MEWVAFTERRPDYTMNTVIVWNARTRRVELCAKGFQGMDRYTHWMPLPDAPVASNTDFNLTQLAASQVKS